jgi:trehalose-6-phosphatase
VTGAAEHGGKHWGQHAARLAALLGARPLGLATDLDGTLSPITLDGPPGVSPALRGAIAALAERWAVVALISGRPVAAVQAVIDLPGLEVFGIHGFERLAGGVATLVPGAVRWQEAIERATGELRVLVERCGAAMQTKGRGADSGRIVRLWRRAGAAGDGSRPDPEQHSRSGGSS